MAIRGILRNEVVPVAGATLVGRGLISGEYDGKKLLDLSRLECLQTINRSKGTISIGACVTFRAIESNRSLGALAAAARGVGGPAIRNRATIGGNLASARTDGDGCVALLAFPSSVELANHTRGCRVVSIDQFFGMREGDTAALDDELITTISLPDKWRSAWREVGVRKGSSHSIVCGAAGMSTAGEVRIALGGVADTVLRIRAAEEEIQRSGGTESSISRAQQAVADTVKPTSNWRASAAYRSAMGVVIVGRLLTDLLRQ